MEDRSINNQTENTAGEIRYGKEKGWFFTLMRLYGTYAKLDLLWFLRDTKYCLLYMVTDVICALAAMAGVLLLSVQFGGFGGMSRNEILFMLSYGIFVDGIFNLFFTGENMGNISRVIGRGQLDHWMIQPVPVWIQMATCGFCPFSGSSKLVCGIIMTVYSLHGLPVAVTPWWVFSFLAGTAASTAVILAFVYIVSCLAFVSPAAAEEIAPTAHSPFDMLKSYPLGGLSAFWKTCFCTVAPVGLAAWLPSLSLLEKAPGMFGPLPVLTIVMAAAYMAAASMLFKKGMNYYGKYGCPRYSGFGHR